MSSSGPVCGSAAASVDAVRGLQISIESLFVSIRHKKHFLYIHNDRNKRRQKITQKIAKEKKRLLEEIVSVQPKA
ncbi:unnamed protein product [Arctogadus glacialis]